MSEKHTCIAQVWVGYSVGRRACGKTAKVEENGKWYCGIHNPQRGRDREAKFKAKMTKYLSAVNRAEELTAARAAVIEAAKEELVKFHRTFERRELMLHYLSARDTLHAAVTRLNKLEGKQ